jgi:DNA-binding LacI/PurR family transcriptional regulator
MPMARLADVAREAEVSISAASVVLGGSSRTIGVSAQTRRRVLDAAARLGYVPSPAAVSLSTGRTNTLGLLINRPAEYLTHPNGALTLVSMCSSAAELGYQVLLIGFKDEAPVDARLIDACIVIGWVDADCARRLERLAARIPVVTTYRPIPGAVFASTEGAAGAAGDLAAEYLYGLGHRRIAVVETTSSRPESERFRAVARRDRLRVDLLSFTDHWRDRLYPSVEAIARLDPPPTAIWAFDDDYARALIARLARDGRRVPEELSVFSGQTHAAGFQSAPALTGVDGHHEREYASIVRVLIESLRQGNGTISDIVLPAATPELIVRESCAPPGATRRAAS